MSLNQANIQRDAKAHRLYAATKPNDATPSITYGNTNTVGSYATPVWPVRAGQDDHLAIASRGLSVQIERV